MTNIKPIILEFLNRNSNIEKIDDTLIDELIFNIDLATKCRKDIDREGYKVEVIDPRTKNIKTIKNISFVAYQDCLKNINLVMTSLAMTPKERQKLKMAIENPDEFDQIMSK